MFRYVVILFQGNSSSRRNGKSEVGIFQDVEEVDTSTTVAEEKVLPSFRSEELLIPQNNNNDNDGGGK